MNGFISVVDTLYDAVVACGVRVVRAYVYADEHARVHGEGYVEAEPPVLVESVQTQVLEDVLPVQSVIADHALVGRGMVMYASQVNTPMFKNPTIEYDAQIAHVPYGSMIMTGEFRGRFCEVSWNGLHGWMLQDDLAERAISVYPVFSKGEVNHVDSPNTAHVRSIIKDEFGLGRSEFDLQAGEYITYRLWKRGIRIAWPLVRPRVPGAWHEILQSVPGISIDTEPRAGSIMEYMLEVEKEGEIGHLAYVEAVFPDGTISISEVNNPDSGIYNEGELPPQKWKSYNPVFITVQ